MTNVMRWTEEQLAAHQAKRAKECAQNDNMEFIDLGGMGTFRTPLPEERDANGNGKLRQVKTARSGPFTDLIALCRSALLPIPVAEHQFHPHRKWRFDYAYTERRLAIEIEGGIWIQGRHTRGAGALGDMRKYSSAALLGWRILYYQPSEMNLALDDIRLEFA
jgi:hypothetical protein